MDGGPDGWLWFAEEAALDQGEAGAGGKSLCAGFTGALVFVFSADVL